MVLHHVRGVLFCRERLGVLITIYAIALMMKNTVR